MEKGRFSVVENDSTVYNSIVCYPSYIYEIVKTL